MAKHERRKRHIEPVVALECEIGLLAVPLRRTVVVLECLDLAHGPVIEQHANDLKPDPVIALDHLDDGIIRCGLYRQRPAAAKSRLILVRSVVERRRGIRVASIRARLGVVNEVEVDIAGLVRQPHEPRERVSASAPAHLLEICVHISSTVSDTSLRRCPLAPYVPVGRYSTSPAPRLSRSGNSNDSEPDRSTASHHATKALNSLDAPTSSMDKRNENTFLGALFLRKVRALPDSNSIDSTLSPPDISSP